MHLTPFRYIPSAFLDPIRWVTDTEAAGEEEEQEAMEEETEAEAAERDEEEGVEVGEG